MPKSSSSLAARLMTARVPAIGAGGISLVVAATLVSWFLVRRVTRPVEELARAADSIAAGEYRVAVPSVGLGSELRRLADAFIHMTGRLSDADAARSRLLADLAHELRTPLATLAEYIDGMEDGAVPEDHTLISALRPTSVLFSRGSTASTRPASWPTAALASA